MRAKPRRRGIIFITALWVVLILGVLVLLFARSMRVEVVASGNRLSAEQASAVELGAEQYVLSVVDNTDGDAIYLLQAPGEALQVGTGYFWLLRPDPDNATNFDYGIVDEASKVNLNSTTLGEQQMMLIPTMTYDAADSVIDWRDADSNPTNQGAENDYYQSLPRPYNAKNSTFETLEEVLLVKGWDETLLWGNDRNHNGILDANEVGGGNASSNGIDTSRGLAPYLTVWSIDPAVGASGTKLVSVNPTQQPATGTGTGTGTGATVSTTGTQGGGTVQTVTTGGQTGGAPAAAGGAQGSTNNALRQLLLTAMPQQRVDQVTNNPAVRNRTFTSIFAWAAAAGLQQQELKAVIDKLSATKANTYGLLNLNTASRTALIVGSGLAEADVDSLIAKRKNTDSTSLVGLSWVSDALSMDKLGKLTNATGRSFVYSADIVAVTADGRAFKRVRIVVDARQTPAKIAYRRDLTSLGWPLVQSIRDSLRAGNFNPNQTTVTAKLY